MGFEVEETGQYEIEQEYLSDLITALVKLNLFFSTTFPGGYKTKTEDLRPKNEDPENT